ncbi:hypothetical protein [Vibrio sp. CyArs1]|uniref:hypothetical protein n=1 Tax=Vibrio sp. CyArs1 TaxID=2682577 RepID=UPI001F056A16|nr:hypothetical protein [Vibrio sp. CyArs1]
MKIFTVGIIHDHSSHDILETWVDEHHIINSNSSPIRSISKDDVTRILEDRHSQISTVDEGFGSTNHAPNSEETYEAFAVAALSKALSSVNQLGDTILISKNKERYGTSYGNLRGHFTHKTYKFVVESYSHIV